MGDGNFTSKIRSTASGAVFFTKLGQFKFRSELREKIEKDSGNSLPAASSKIEANASTRVENRLRDEVAVVASDINRRANQLKLTKESLKSEERGLIDLKEAHEEGDQSRVQKVSEELQQSRDKREQFNLQILKEQEPSVSTRVIILGEKEHSRIDLPNIKLSKIEEYIPRNAQEAQTQIKGVGQDLEAITVQEQAIGETRKLLSDILDTKRAQYAETSPDSIKSINSAQVSAIVITSTAKNLSADELLSSVADNLDPESVSFIIKD
jgi:hypothetical protein